MGNKLCAPWKRGYRDEDHPWAHKKDSHLLRLWAEIFEVREEDTDICWARVSDDVVPVNITCIQDSPDTVFQITAYNRHVEKIFDVRLIQPGTRITQASECFVHWRDSRCDHEWGLNFTTPVDARRFRDCCMLPSLHGPSTWKLNYFDAFYDNIFKSSAGHNYARKASSSGSLRLSPPKRVKGSRKTISNPTSPISAPRRAVSSPEELGKQDGGFRDDTLGVGVTVPESAYSGIEHIATVPRNRPRNNNGLSEHNGLHKSDMSVYDNVNKDHNKQDVYENPYETVMVQRRPPPLPDKNMHKPIAEREIPYSTYQSMDHSSIYATTYQTYKNPKSIIRDNSQEDNNKLSGTEEENPYKIIGDYRKKDTVDSQYTEEDVKYTCTEEYGRTEIRQFSREPTMLRIAEQKESFTDSIEAASDYDNLPINRVDNLVTVRFQDATPEEEEEEDNTPNTLSPPPPGPSHSSSSPDWPPPPPDGTLVTMETPALVTDKFDSNTLKKMLRNLPLGANGAAASAVEVSSPEQTREDEQTDYQPIEFRPPPQRPSSSSSSSPTHSNNNASNSNNLQHSNSGSVHSNSGAQSRTLDSRPPPGPIKPQRIPLESGSDLPFQAHGAKSRDSYIADGVVVMATDTPPRDGSVRSGDSERSRSSSRSTHTLPAGLGLHSHRSSGGSSGGSSSGRHSDHLRHSGTGSGSETTEVRQLTSDISDSETGSSSEAVESDTSSIHTMPSESQANFASKSAAVRKAGWLTVKNWLIHKKRRIELASKRSWKRYWVCLKGTMLLFYSCDDNDSVNEDSVPGHMLVIEGGISQAVPEHPKRENIFALSTAFGDAYLFQAPTQTEQENWIQSLHSACASSYARQHGKENTLKLLRSEIQKLENSIDLDIKMKKMAGLQLTVVTDPKSKQAIEKQIAQWDENLEKLFMEQYRLRCYMASLQGSELPNPKTLLGCASKASKALLSRVGVFTVTSFHALVCARTPLTHANIYNTRQKRGLLSTFKADSVTKIRPKSPRSFSPPSSHMFKNPDVSDQVLVDLSKHEEELAAQLPGEASNYGDGLLRVDVPNSQSVVVAIMSDKTVIGDVLESACNKRQLNPNDHFLRVRVLGTEGWRIPDKDMLVNNEEYECIEVCAKTLFRLSLTRAEPRVDFGVEVEAELAEDAETEDQLCVFVSEVTKGSIAAKKGLQIGDEILVMNGKVVAELDMVYVENLLLEELAITLTIRSCRTDSPVNTTTLMEHADLYIENMMCPPPPSQARMSDKFIGELIVPAPNWVQAERSDDSGSGTDPSPRTSRDMSSLSSEQINHLLQGAEQVTHFCRLLHEPLPESMASEEAPPVKPLSDSQRIRKVIVELIETERQYVKDLRCLIERYLEPLNAETYLSGEDIEQLFGNIQEIVTFQKIFLLNLQEAVELEPNFNIFTDPQAFKDEDLRRVLFSLAGSFLHYANHFKLYSSFCASHSKAQKMLNPDSNQQLQDFLRARNPKQQHSSTLESFLIKPIQRILKYPLLLRQLKDLTDPQSDEHHHLTEALRGMEAVAEHINEMQKIYEEYGGIFDDLIRQYKEVEKKSLDLNVGELQMYGTVTWLNALDELGKMKKGTDLITLVFIFKAGIVVLAHERIRGKKKVKPMQGRPPTSMEGGDQVRFQVAISVDELQVRAAVGETDRHGVWELIHCRSEKEGRPEKIFQFASSHEARRDFVKVINNTIRESVRRMSLPGSRGSSTSLASNKLRSPSNGSTQSPQSQSQQSLPQYIPYNNGGKRPDSLVMRPNQGTAKKKGQKVKGELARHSMDVEPGGSEPDSNSGSVDFRTRSQTLTDLNSVDLQYDHTYNPSGSQSTIASESRGSAKLVHASNNPTNYSNQNVPKRSEGPGSPIWKPRNHQKKAVTVRSPSSTEDKGLESAVFTGSAYGDYSNVVPENKKHSVYLTHPNAYFEHEDTEC